MRVVAGLARGHRLIATEDREIRPTSDRTKEAVFNMIQNKVENSYFLDMYSGSGAMGIEALSRGAKFVMMVECNKKHSSIIKENIKHVEKALGDFEYALIEDYVEFSEDKIAKYKFDIIFIDPPYNKNMVPEAMKLVHELNILKDNGLLIVEQSKREEKAFDDNFNLIDERNYGNAVIYIFDKNK